MVQPTQEYLEQLIEIKKLLDRNKGKPIAFSKLLKKQYNWTTTEASTLMKLGIVEKTHTGGKGAVYYYDWVGENPSMKTLEMLVTGRRELYKRRKIIRSKKELIEFAKEDSPKIEDLNIDTKKIGEFLKELSPAERIYLGHSLNLSENINKLIAEYKLSRENVCAHFHIKWKEYENFVAGNWNYTIVDMARLNTLHSNLREEANSPVKFKD